MRMSIEQRLLYHTAHEPNTGCWIWTASRWPSGYGQIMIRDKSNGEVRDRPRGAHIVSFELINGPKPDKMLVLHNCRLKLCINPKHLYLGTHGDNLYDAYMKGERGKDKRTPHRRMIRTKPWMTRWGTMTTDKR